MGGDDEGLGPQQRGQQLDHHGRQHRHQREHAGGGQAGEGGDLGRHGVDGGFGAPGVELAGGGGELLVQGLGALGFGQLGLQCLATLLGLLHGQLRRAALAGRLGIAARQGQLGSGLAVAGAGDLGGDGRERPGGDAGQLLAQGLVVGVGLHCLRPGATGPGGGRAEERGVAVDREGHADAPQRPAGRAAADGREQVGAERDRHSHGHDQHAVGQRGAALHCSCGGHAAADERSERCSAKGEAGAQQHHAIRCTIV